MTQVQITNGTVRFGRTVKTGDFENKRGDIELSFTVPEGFDASDAIGAVEELAAKHLIDLLDLNTPANALAGRPVVKESAPKPPKPPKPVEVKTADAATVEEPETPAFLKKEIADKSADEDIDDLLGDAPKEITDVELMDAAQKCKSETKNGPAIRKILNDLGIRTPPGRIIDLPQEKRQIYLDNLKQIKSLA